MRESQAEIKAIEAQLRSIRVESRSPQRGSSTLLEPPSRESPSTHPPVRNTHASGLSSSQERFTDSPPPANSSQPAHVSSPTKSAQTKQVEGYPLPLKHRLPSHLEATVHRLQEQSAFYVEQFRQLQSPSFQTPAQLLAQRLKILEAQVQHINQLSTVQESALLELKSIAEQVEREWQSLERCQDGYATKTELNNLPICEYLDTAVPQIEKNEEGVYVLSARSLDLFKAEREAALTAQSLRHWANRKHSDPSHSTRMSPSIWHWLTHLRSPADAEQTRSRTGGARVPEQPISHLAPPTASGQPSQALRQRRSYPHRPVSRSVLRLKEAVALFLGAVIVRLVLDMVMTSFPMLGTPAIALVVTPVAIAVYRSSSTPQAGLIWGYRLLIIMIGLLIGARL